MLGLIIRLILWDPLANPKKKRKRLEEMTIPVFYKLESREKILIL